MPARPRDCFWFCVLADAPHPLWQRARRRGGECLRVDGTGSTFGALRPVAQVTSARDTPEHETQNILASFGAASKRAFVLASSPSMCRRNVMVGATPIGSLPV